AYTALVSEGDSGQKRFWKRGLAMWKLSRVTVAGRTGVGILIALAFAMLSALRVPAAAGPQGDVTFTKDVAPILQRSCQRCHRPESVAPMSLITYEEARPWARSMKAKTALREMPPWFVEKNIGIQQFKDDISLTDDEIATIAAWAD